MLICFNFIIEILEKLKYINYGRKKNDLSLSGAHERGRNGTEICEGSI